MATSTDQMCKVCGKKRRYKGGLCRTCTPPADAALESDVRITDIDLDASQQVRHPEHATGICERYTEAMRDAEGYGDFPRVVLFGVGRKPPFFVGDGFNRIGSASDIGLEEIPALIYDGDAEAAFDYAIGANAANERVALPWTNKDKRHAITLTLTRRPDWNDSEIARRCHSTHKTVASVRQSILGISQDRPIGTTRLVRRGGTAYEMDTSSIGKRNGKPTPSDPKTLTHTDATVPADREPGDDSDLEGADDDTPVATAPAHPARYIDGTTSASEDATGANATPPALQPAAAESAPAPLTDRVGVPVPESSLAAFQADALFAEALRLLRKLDGVLSEAAASTAGRFLVRHLRTVRRGDREVTESANVAALKEQIKFDRPYAAVCPPCHAAGAVDPACRHCHGGGWVPFETWRSCRPEHREAVLALAVGPAEEVGGGE